ncbi:MAG: hypothetical protein ACK5LM_04295 [Lactovum sp.]
MKKIKFLSLFFSLFILTACINNNTETKTKENSKEVSKSSSSQAINNKSLEFETRDIDVPIDYSISETDFINSVVTRISDNGDGDYAASLKVTGLDYVDWDTVGVYQVTISAQESNGDYDDDDVEIYVNNTITDLQTHIDSADEVNNNDDDDIFLD